MPSSPSARFEDELEVFRREVEWGMQCWYGGLALNGIPFHNRKLLEAINTTPLFWMTARGAMQSTSWIVLGRIFDQDSAHNVDALLRLAQVDRHAIFSKEALAARKIVQVRQSGGGTLENPPWLSEYLKTAHEPTVEEFRRLRKHVAKHRRVYQAKYKNIRDKIHAHKELTGEEADRLYRDTTIREVELLFNFLNRLYLALWELLNNGRRPVLRAIPYSAHRMIRVGRDIKDQPGRSRHVQQIMVAETKTVLKRFAAGVREFERAV